MAIKHTKERQRVWSWYQDPIRLHPAKVWEFGRIKISKYPQELGEGVDWNSQYYKGWLVTFNIRRPRWRPIGRFYFDLHVNNGVGLIAQLKSRLTKLFGKKTIVLEGEIIPEQVTENAESND